MATNQQSSLVVSGMVTRGASKVCRKDGLASSTALTTWTRHPELWLAHGDIILVCQDIGFCVGKCILSLNSQIFREMLKVVDPAQNEMSDGLPVVRLHDDAEEMCHLLKGIHFERYMRKKSKPSFKVLAAILKLSSKYMVDDLRDKVTDILRAIFPSTLSSMGDQNNKYIPDDLDTLYAVELAQQYDIPIILPAAYYMSGLHSVKKIMDPTFSVASTATRCACAVFHDELMNAMDKALEHARSADQWLFKDDLRDLNHDWPCAADECCILFDTWLQDIELELRRLLAEDFFSPMFGKLNTENACQVLKQRFDEYWHGIQLEIWNTLPSLCGFENWAALHAAQSASSATHDEEATSTA